MMSTSEAPEVGVEELVTLLQATPSPLALLHHYPTLGLPLYWYRAVGYQDPPYTPLQVRGSGQCSTQYSVLSTQYSVLSNQ